MLAKELRAQAEAALNLTTHEVGSLSDPGEVLRLVHELQVHQIELEMQNESLRQAQLRAETSLEQYQDLFESAPVGYLLLDPRGSIVRINTAGIALLGMARVRVTGQSLSAFVSPLDWPMLRERLQAVAASGHTTCEVRLRDDNPFAHIRVDLSLAAGDQGECLVVLTDIGQHKRDHEALERANRELEERVAKRTHELASRNRELEAENEARARSESLRRKLEARLRESERFESLGMMAAGIAHDFNNLLVGVVASADLMLLQPNVPEEWRSALEAIKHAGRSAAELTRHLLVFTGHGELRLGAVNLQRVVAGAVDSLRQSIPPSIELRAEVGAELPMIEADADQVSQLLNNLVTNAAEAIHDRGHIVLRAELADLDEAALSAFRHRNGAEPGRYVILQVHDSGSGIEPATLARIFDPFFSTKFTGRGLGLASVLGIVHGHRGALGVHTRAGAGTRFEVAFRTVQRPAERSTPPRPLDPSWVGSGPLLLIDDDDAVRASLRRMLEHIGFDVTDASSGRLGLELFSRHEPRFPVVVLDWLMPGLSGEQVLRELRALEPALPIVLVSGYSAQDFGAGDRKAVRLQKPMTLDQLRDALRIAIGEAPSRLPA